MDEGERRGSSRVRAVATAHPGQDGLKCRVSRLMVTML
jgi:hypothetical protein